MADLIASLLERILNTNTAEAVSRRATRWLKRNEQARLYHHHSRKILPSLKNQLNL